MYGCDDEQRKLWIAEQLEIASKVIVLPDDPHDCAENGRFFGQPTDPLKCKNHNGFDDDSSIADFIYFGGVDVSFMSEERVDESAVAVYVVMSYPSMQIVYQDHKYFRLTVPYIPSFLSFREIEPTVSLIEEQQSKCPQYTPSVILVDGNGIWHPRRAGFACCVGVRTAIPTIGIGKTLFYEGGVTKSMVSQAISNSVSEVVYFCEKLHANDSVVIFDRKIVQHTMEVKAVDRRHSSALCDRINDGIMEKLSSVCIGLAIPLSGGEVESPILAYALVGQGGRRAKQTSGSKNPIFISVGHGLSLRKSVMISAQLCTCARIPEPVRQADLRGRELLRQKQNAVV
jgi:deoxyinosine 3'endonuclease (endonuclease V)